MLPLSSNRVWLMVWLALSVGGFYFLGLAGSFLGKYFFLPQTPYSGEYIQGAVLSAFMSLPFWLLVSGCSYFARRGLSKRALALVNAPSVVLLVGFVAANLYAIVTFLLGR